MLGNQKKQMFAGDVIKGVRGWTWPRRRIQTTVGFSKVDGGLWWPWQEQLVEGREGMSVPCSWLGTGTLHFLTSEGFKKYLFV